VFVGKTDIFNYTRKSQDYTERWGKIDKIDLSTQ
jgi:hypothetical protein